MKDAIEWRRDILGGEEKIYEYQEKLANEGGKRVAEILGTEILQNKAGTLTNCAMVNVALPLAIGPDPSLTNGAAAENRPKGIPEIPFDKAPAMTQWLQETLVEDYKTFTPVFPYKNQFWVRLSAQVYLELDDFEWAGNALKDLCKRAAASTTA